MHRPLDTTLRSLRQDTRLDPAIPIPPPSSTPAPGPAIAGATACLGPVPLIRWLLVQVLHRNTALPHVSLMAGRTFTASALAHARNRLPLAVLQALFRV